MKTREEIWQDEKLVQTLSEGGVVVMPTDTVYGLVCRARNTVAVNRVYTIRKRATEKPCIILIGEWSELEKFNIELTDKQREALIKIWPGPVSVGLECNDDTLAYLHRGTNSLAFRVPDSENLQKLLKVAGPLIAPSANPEGEPVARNIAEAKDYFGDLVDLYMDGGEIIAAPSKIIKLNSDGSEEVLRD